MKNNHFTIISLQLPNLGQILLWLKVDFSLLFCSNKSPSKIARNFLNIQTSISSTWRQCALDGFPVLAKNVAKELNWKKIKFELKI